MKRIVCFVLLVLIVWGTIPLCGFADETDMETIYFDDDSYIMIEISQPMGRASGSITGSKNYTYYDSNGSSQWKAVLTGSFTYTGTSATCTSSNVSVTIYDSTWSVNSKSASKNGNTATAYVQMVQKALGLTVKTVPVNMTLSCDSNGNLS